MDLPRQRDHGFVVVGLGEALFDCFTDHVQIGGAPVNLAIHAHSLLRRYGGRAVVASAVGDDPLGRQFLSTLADFDMDSRAVKVDYEHATSRVNVSIDRDGQPSYEFEADVAWDHLEFADTWQKLADECDAVGFGTLAQRSAKSCDTIVQFLRSARSAIRLFDVNLRGNYYSSDVLRQSFELASAAKLSAEELPIVCGLLDLQGPEMGRTDQVIELLIKAFRLDWMALTRGSQGTVLYIEGKRYEAPVPDYPRQMNADSVGAGDACGAALLVAALLRWPHQHWVNLANDMGAFVASRAGAIPSLPRHLTEYVFPPDGSVYQSPPPSGAQVVQSAQPRKSGNLGLSDAG